jgi:hypothetical protein
MCTQPLSAMLALRKVMPHHAFPRIKPTSLMLNTRHMATRASKTKLMPLPSQDQTETSIQTITQQNNIDVFTNYPYLKHLSHDSLLRKNCELRLARMHIHQELEKSLADLEYKCSAHENEDVLNIVHNITNNELRNNTLALKKQKKELADKLHEARVALPTDRNEYLDSVKKLNNGLKWAHENGTPIFSSRQELLQHMKTHPHYRSLVNCYRHYPALTVSFIANVIFAPLLLISDVPVIDILFFMNMMPIPCLSAIAYAFSHSYKESVYDLLGKKSSDNVKQAALENYKNVANMLLLKEKKSNETLGQRIDEFTKKLSNIRSKS